MKAVYISGLGNTNKDNLYISFEKITWNGDRNDFLPNLSGLLHYHIHEIIYYSMFQKQ